jgi:nitroimidazol reductase NimA-like FMN-containing flavoprotein (pyridoxamine 5'-phosphate oxidase superfamily)
MNHDITTVLEFLKHHHMGVLSTVSAEGEPWGSAITFAFDDDLTFYFMTRSDTLKFKNIESHPSVALTVADEEQQITVQAIGKVSRVDAKDYIDVAFKKLASVKPRGDYQWVPPVIKVHKGDYMILSFKPSKLQYADFKHGKTDLHHEYIHQII